MILRNPAGGRMAMLLGCLLNGFVALVARAPAADAPRVAPVAALPEASGGEQSQTWWIIADTHIGSHRRGEARALDNLLAAVADVNELRISQRAIVLGDFVHDHPRFVAAYEEAMNGLHHPWIDVLGNHDYDRHDTGRRVKDRSFFSFEAGGVRFIALSDDGRWEDGDAVQGYQAETNLRADQNDWFRAELDKNPGQPTVLLTHQGLRRMTDNPRDDGPCYWDPNRRGWLQENWDAYNIVMWIRGHRHPWALEENYLGLGFVDVSPGALATAYGGGIFLTITPGEEGARLSLRFRDHRNRKWIAVEGRREYVLWLE